MNVTQSAGGNMTGVNAAGTQTIRDITVYTQNLNQTGASINDALKTALIESREAIDAEEISPVLKPILIEQFDKLTEELKKGDKKDHQVVKGLWTLDNGTQYNQIDSNSSFRNCQLGKAVERNRSLT